MKTLTKNCFNKTEIPESVTKTAEDFVEYLKKLIIGIDRVEYTFGISLIRFEIFFKEKGRDLSVFLGRACNRNWQSKCNSFFNVNSSTLYQDGNRLIIEVPHENRCILHYDRAIEALNKVPKEEGKLQFYIGEDVKGNPVISNIVDYSHLLISGSTGSGKSINMQGIILSLLSRYTEEELNMYFFDTKRVEFSMYINKNLPQVKGAATDPQDVHSLLKELQAEMNRRYSIISQYGYQDIIEYNKHNPDKKIPAIVIMFDEYADLSLLCGKTAVDKIVLNIVQKSRAANMYVILCTQRPDHKTFDTNIREELNGRICFKVSSAKTSSMVIKCQGAERLLGKGDGYFQVYGLPIRFQSAMLSAEEIKNAVAAMGKCG